MDSGMQRWPDRLVDQAEAAAFLHVKPRTLEAWRKLRQGPRFIAYSSRCVRYRLSDLQAWLDERVVSTEAR
jgi:predicted DNA-binding transcriptional regulator AlpA